MSVRPWRETPYGVCALPMMLLRGANRPVVFFGAEHAREWIASTVPSYIATHLLESYGSDGAVTELVDNVEFFLIPVMNVDGFNYTWTKRPALAQEPAKQR